MSIEKKMLAKNGVCKVTFKLPASLSGTAKTAKVVGEFNNWDPSGIPMKKAKNGQFTTTLELPGNSKFEFRYLVDDTNWETDFEADDLAPIPFGDEYNSVVKV